MNRRAARTRKPKKEEEGWKKESEKDNERLGVSLIEQEIETEKKNTKTFDSSQQKRKKKSFKNQ
jgi:hypothetical protein